MIMTKMSFNTQRNKMRITERELRKIISEAIVNELDPCQQDVDEFIKYALRKYGEKALDCIETAVFAKKHEIYGQ